MSRGVGVPRGSIGRAPTILAAVGLVAILAGCGGAAETPPPAAFTPPPRTTGTPGPSSSAELPESPVAGVVTRVDSSGLSAVKGFTLRTTAGDDLTFVIGTLENGAEFPPGHLVEHMTSADPILVYFRVENGALVVYKLDDAP